MVKTCPKCNYTRNERDANPDWQCPSCGIAYVKAEQAASGAAQGSFVREVLPATTVGSSPMSFTESVGYCLRNYVTFSGRASRSEYWWFFLFVLVFPFLVSLAGEILGGLASLGLLLPSLAAWARRLHDINRSGWWLLILFLPLIGIILLIVWAILPGTDGTNDYDQ